VLTMTATPIPRTLHLALLGIRDISSLSTPPQDRRSIHTEVGHYEPEQIREGILRELGRDGQVFFVHNRVHNIRGVADEVSRLVPEARVTYAHGQMPESGLQERMLAFFDHKVDVLVTTTIIESGLDIPTANTMFVNDADGFGLAELHQLRGRIGRYKHRAHCYLLLPTDRPLTPTAARRLQAIQRYSELGSGFQIAMRDLEIRGAGNILGREQSGNIATVGYEMYCRLLASAVRRAQGLPDEERRLVDVELDVPAHIPDSYVPGEGQRIAVYRQLGRAGSPEVLAEIRGDLLDIYGPVPPEVDLLLDLAAIRLLSQAWGISSICLRPAPKGICLARGGCDLIFTLDDLGVLGRLFGQDVPGKVRVVDSRTVQVRLKPEMARFAVRRIGVLKKMLAGGQG